MRKGKRVVWLLAAAVILAVSVFMYAGDYYRASEEAAAALVSTEEVTVTVTDDRAVFAPREAHTGLVFYPGGKVEFTAYAPLMRDLAEEGVLCLVLRMPLNLAVLDVHAAEGIPEEYPEVENWYLAGHSLGGSMAASHLSQDGDYRGLILLASYSTADLKQGNLPVLSIYGDRDGVLNRESYEQNRQLLPENTREVILSGGNHAQFGSYGHQEGDGEAAISPEEQRSATAEEILAFVSAA